MADPAAWRLTVEAPGHGKALQDRLQSDTPDLDLGSGKDELFVYAPARADLERALPAVRAVLETLAIEPNSVAIDQWLENEMRWSSETEEEAAEPGRMSWSTLLESLERNSPI
jgi:hypothetical protein